MLGGSERGTGEAALGGGEGAEGAASASDIHAMLTGPDGDRRREETFRDPRRQAGRTREEQEEEEGEARRAPGLRWIYYSAHGRMVLLLMAGRRVPLSLDEGLAGIGLGAGWGPC